MEMTWKYFSLSNMFLLLAVTTCSSQYSMSDLALHKMTTQSGVYFGRGPNRAVDGITDPGSDGLYCSTADTSDPSYTGNRDYAWWQVDLADSYQNIIFTIYSSGPYEDWRYIYGFDVYLSDGPDISDAGNRKLCQSVEAIFLAAHFQDNETSISSNCSTPVVGRYVTIKRNGGPNPQRLTLCEVEIEGTRYYSCQNCHGSCDSTNGCSSCNVGYYPPACTSTCDPGTYGINCAQQCPPCPEYGTSCDRVTGECRCIDPNGCGKPPASPGPGTNWTATDTSTTSSPTSGTGSAEGRTTLISGVLPYLLISQLLYPRRCYQ